LARTIIARAQFVESLPTVTTQGFVPAQTLREQQSFNAIDVPDSLGDQHFALAAETATILFLGGKLDKKPQLKGRMTPRPLRTTSTPTMSSL
jgi:hypothetical protein